MQRVTNLAYVVFWDFTIQLDHPREHLALCKGCKGSQSSQKDMVFHRLNCSRAYSTSRTAVYEAHHSKKFALFFPRLSVRKDTVAELDLTVRAPVHLLDGWLRTGTAGCNHWLRHQKLDGP